MCPAQGEFELELAGLSEDDGCGVCGGGDWTTESESDGSKTVRPRSLLETGRMEEMIVEAGTATKVAGWLTPSSLTDQDSVFPVLGGRVRVTVGVGMRVTEISALPVAIYPTRAHINPKLWESQ
jgi:hypothetical protein